VELRIEENKMRRSILVTTIMSSVFAISLASTARADNDYEDMARVISVTPQVERVNMPRQDCRTEYVPQSYNNGSKSPIGSIIGGVAGGLLGSQIGKGTGRIAGAAVGAGVGAVVGDRIDNSQPSSYGSRPVDSCVTVDNWQTVTRGYLVAYEYQGRQYTTVSNVDPGPTMRVHISVSPVSAPANVGYYDATPSPVIYRESVYMDGRHGNHGRRDYW
jgi:uncharacterized protein YcfJ